MKAPEISINPVPKAAGSKRIGIWIRVSTDDQARGESPAIHLRRAQEYAGFQGWNVVEVYDLSGVSGKTVLAHPLAIRMLEDVKRGHITGLIVSKLARLARNTKELLEFAERFRADGADIVSLQERIDTSTPAGRLFYTMIAAMAQWEREEIVDRVKASITARAKMGKPLGGAAPFGYQWKDRKLVPHPDEAPIRRLIYEWFAQDRRRKSVARRLNVAGYRTRNRGKFTDTTVTRLLQDPSAKGLYRSNHTFRDPTGKLQRKPETEWVHTPIEPIVSEELWMQCNALLDSRKDKAALGPKPIHLFAGLLVCECGGKMYVLSRTSKYVCSKCRAKIPMSTLETIFRDGLSARFMNQETVQQHLLSKDKFLDEKRRLVNAHGAQLEKVRAEMRKVYALYQADQISLSGFGDLYKPLEEREKALSQELPRLQGELDALEMRQISAAEVVAEAVDLHRMWSSFPSGRKREVIDSIVEKIVLYSDFVDVKLWYQSSSEELTIRQRNLSDSSRPRA